jgi:hypothetical protein
MITEQVLRLTSHVENITQNTVLVKRALTARIEQLESRLGIKADNRHRDAEEQRALDTEQAQMNDIKSTLNNLTRMLEDINTGVMMKPDYTYHKFKSMYFRDQGYSSENYNHHKNRIQPEPVPFTAPAPKRLASPSRTLVNKGNDPFLSDLDNEIFGQDKKIFGERKPEEDREKFFRGGAANRDSKHRDSTPPHHEMSERSKLSSPPKAKSKLNNVGDLLEKPLEKYENDPQAQEMIVSYFLQQSKGDIIKSAKK